MKSIRANRDLISNQNKISPKVSINVDKCLSIDDRNKFASSFVLLFFYRKEIQRLVIFIDPDEICT